MVAFLLLVSGYPAFAVDPEPIARVLAASAGATFEGKPVSEDMPLLVDGTLRTPKDGGAKLELAGSKTIVDLAPNTEVRVTRTPVGATNQQIELVSGFARVRVKPAAQRPAGSKGAFTLRTKAGTMGVRGTDFLGVAHPVLNEAEIVVFEGKVEFASVANPKDLKMISAGYWGGIGGRFGAKVTEPIALSQDALKHFENLTKASPAFSVKGATKQTPSDAVGAGN